MFPASLQKFDIGTNQLQAYVPEMDIVKTYYEQNKATIPFPYWAQVWPAALGLCHFLVEHKHYIQNKNVVELAAGLGLPSLLAAKYAKTVLCSDHILEAVVLANRSVEHNHFINMQCAVVDWNHLPDNLSTDVLLLSDVNYKPEVFDELYAVLHELLQKKTTILLSTPQRLIAKVFIDRLLPFCIQQWEELVASTTVNVLVLKK